MAFVFRAAVFRARAVFKGSIQPSFKSIGLTVDFSGLSVERDYFAPWHTHCFVTVFFLRG